MKRQTIKRLVRLLLPYGRPLRGRFSIRSHTTSGHHRNGSVSRDPVPVRQYVSLPPRPHGVLRRFYGQAGFHNGSVSCDSVPVR